MNIYSGLAISAIWGCSAYAGEHFLAAVVATYFVAKYSQPEPVEQPQHNLFSDDEDYPVVPDVLFDDPRPADTNVTYLDSWTSKGPVFPESAFQGHVHFLETEVDIKIYRRDGIEWESIGTIDYAGRKPAVMATIIEE